MVNKKIYSLIAILLIAAFLYIRQNKRIDIHLMPPSLSVITPTPSPSFLPSGTQTYHISHANQGGPAIASLTLSPLDAALGTTQTIDVVLTSQSLIDEVAVRVLTDSSEKTLTLSRRGDTTWSTQWTLPDTVLYRYIFVLTAGNTKGNTRVIVAPRTTKPMRLNDL